MLEGVMIASDCADWWENQLKDFHTELEEYVTNNPGYFGVIVATSVASTADLAGAFFIDLLHLGEGFASGGVKGVAQDLLRVAQFIPEGKVIEMAEPLLWSLKKAKVLRNAVKNFQTWATIHGGFCVPIGITQALLRTGQKVGISLVEIAEALGTKIDVLKTGAGSDWNAIELALTKLGVQFKTIPAQGITKFEQLAELVNRSGEPHLVRVLVGDAKSGHTFLIAKTPAGARIIERTSDNSLGMFKSIEELSNFYQKMKFEIDTSVNIFSFKNVAVSEELLNLVNQFGVLGCLVRVSSGVFGFNHQRVSAEFIEKDFQRFTAQKGGGKAPVPGDEIKVSGGKTVEVMPGMTLSDIAQARYGDWKLWTLIYDLNKAKIGANPNRVQPRLRLLVVPITAYTAVEIAEAKRRASSWRNFP